MFHAGLICALLEYLEATNTNPALYGVLLFFYAALATVILPIPVEFALLHPVLGDWTKAAILGAGKAAGAMAIFTLGLRVEDSMKRWSATHPIFERGLHYAFRFVRVTRWIGLLILLSIPFMPDTVPIYLYSLFNEGGKAIRPPAFVAVNFAAGMIRAGIFLVFIPPTSACP